MPGRRRHYTRLPDLRIAAQLKLYRSTIHKEVAMLQPILGPCLSIDLHRLHIVAVLVVEIVGFDGDRLVRVDGQIDLREPRRFDEVGGLRDL